VKHITPITQAPRQAQLPNVSLSAVFGLIANILIAVSTAVLSKENSEFPDIPLPGSSA
jgi:hypothetical protein